MPDYQETVAVEKLRKAVESVIAIARTETPETAFSRCVVARCDRALTLLTEQEAELGLLRKELDHERHEKETVRDAAVAHADWARAELATLRETLAFVRAENRRLSDELYEEVKAKQEAQGELATLRAENDKLRVENAALGWTVNPEGMGR